MLERHYGRKAILLIDEYDVPLAKAHEKGYYSDILVRDWNRWFAMVIEVKYAEDGDVESAARAALNQIDQKRYAAVLQREKFTDIRKYGIAFHLKNCVVVLG